MGRQTLFLVQEDDQDSDPAESPLTRHLAPAKLLSSQPLTPLSSTPTSPWNRVGPLFEPFDSGFDGESQNRISVNIHAI